MTSRLDGLAVIAAACDTSVDQLMTWHLDHGFPLRRRGAHWWTTEAAIDAWGKRRLQVERVAASECCGIEALASLLLLAGEDVDGAIGGGGRGIEIKSLASRGGSLSSPTMRERMNQNIQ